MPVAAGRIIAGDGAAGVSQRIHDTPGVTRCAFVTDRVIALN